MLLYIIVLCIFIVLVVNVEEGYKYYLLFKFIWFLNLDSEEWEYIGKMCNFKNVFKFIWFLSLKSERYLYILMDE